MFHDRIQTKPVPKWTICDRVIDITDIWQEETDPENVNGETCKAHLHANKYDDGMEIAGICVDDGFSKIYRDREQASRLLSWDAIYRAEQYEMQAGDYGADDRYDAWKEAR